VTRVVILDHGSGNLRSAERALTRVGAWVEVTSDLDEARDCDGLVVPGVGAFAHCAAGLRSIGGDVAVLQRVADERPVLGICVGMQLLFEGGREGTQPGAAVVPGLGVLPGVVERLQAPVLPHMGWNTVAAAGSLVDDDTYYFVHSYAAPVDIPGAQVSVAVHGQPFAAAVERGALTATQFHPEKSADAGLALLHRWVRSL
jgi:glutamine amidotransferase